MSSLFRPVSRFALACAAVAAVPACNLVLGLDDYIDCPEDAKCASVGGSGGATATTSGTSSTTDSMSTSSSTSSATGGTGGSGGAPPVPTCTDGVKNGGETGKDCGGSCAPTMPCPDGEGCLLGTDCVSNVCKGNLCIAPMCGDMLKNGSETDVDCGGSLCPPCAVGKVCAVAGDCESAVCTGMACVAATCTDTVKNGAETAVDCGGGGCPGCAPGLACNGAGDCESAICQANSCVDYRVWGRRFGDGQDQTGSRVSVDSLGDVIFQGIFNGTIDLGGGALVNTYMPDPQDPADTYIPDYFVAKLTGDGTFVWRKQFVTAFPGGAYLGFASAPDSSNNVFLVAPGNTNGSFNFGGAPLPNPAACPPNCDNIGTGVAKLSSSGAHLWSKRFDVTGGHGNVAGWDAATDGTNIVTVGALVGSANFGGGVLTSNASDVFALKLDSNGVHVWSKRFGDTAATEQCGRAVATDGAGNVMLAGFFKGGVSFGGPTLTSTGGFDIFVAKLGPSGNHLWSKRFGDVQDQANSCSEALGDITVTVDPSGNTILAGRLKGSFNFGGATLTGNGSDAFVARFDSNGTHVWSKAFPGVVLGRPATDAANAVILTGTSSAAVVVGSVTLAGSGGFVMKLASGGAHLWSKRMTAIDGRGLAATSTGHLLLTGALKGTEDFGGTPLVTAGATDAFVAKILNP